MSYVPLFEPNFKHAEIRTNKDKQYYDMTLQLLFLIKIFHKTVFVTKTNDTICLFRREMPVFGGWGTSTAVSSQFLIVFQKSNCDADVL